MLTCYVTAVDNRSGVPVVPVVEKDFPGWLAQQDDCVRNWVNQLGFTAKPETFCWIPSSDSSQIQQVLLGITDASDFWPFGELPFNLPKGIYRIADVSDENYLLNAMMAWGFGAYEFTRYKKPVKPFAQLMVEEKSHQKLQALVKATYLVRDLINTPAEDMGPLELGDAAWLIADSFGATVDQIVGDDLIQQNYPAIHMVGRASSRAPRLIDLRWGSVSHPRVTLVGKGVCFDSGGLDLKSATGMAMMKKDMAGAAHVLGLAYLIMSMSLPVYLRVLIPAVDNVISGNAYRPGDIIVTRKGLSVEVTNTDAEGRLVVADTLTEAASEQPDLLLDFTTLTGAARVALGTDITAMFCNHPELARSLIAHAKTTQDPIVELPLYKPYRKYLDSKVADLANAVLIPYGGAITAGLFLNEFVPAHVPWAHFDLMAWNLMLQPGRPEGGEAMAIRAVWDYLMARYQLN